jgi:glycosyltransferase involved in cell wall biosynthesis
VVEKKLLILGTRGIPAMHGGFETFAEGFAIDMVSRGWDVTVYCQLEVGDKITETQWQGVRCVNIPVPYTSAIGTIIFDLKSVFHAIREDGIALTLGYNTAIFSVLHRIARQPNVMNMDGVEWKREKWSLAKKVWLYCNEWLGARLANHLVADHPEIKRHLQRHTRDQKITVIPYGAESITSAPTAPLAQYGLSSGNYAILIARPEPENSILEVVRSFVKSAPGMPLVVLGNYDPENNIYHRQVLAAGDENILFVGAIYDSEVVSALRHHAKVYIHGHTVGGTNPSLIEAMAAGNPVIAHGNVFNRWVVGDGGIFFEDEASLCEALKLCDDAALLKEKAATIIQRHDSVFRPVMIHDTYEQVLQKLL